MPFSSLFERLYILAGNRYNDIIYYHRSVLLYQNQMRNPFRQIVLKRIIEVSYEHSGFHNSIFGK